MDYYIGTFVFIVGLVIGSFLNVCIYRIPNELSIVNPPSNCPNCKAKIKWYDLFPVISYIALKGKCRNCGVKISARYMLIEFLTGALFLGCFLVFGFTGQLLSAVVFTSILITITFIDIDYQIIPNPIMLFGLIAGIIFILVGFSPELGQGLKQNAVDGLLGMLLGAGPLLIINLLSVLIIKRAGIGGGDIKLMGVAGLFLGMERTILALVMGIIIAGLYSMVYLRFRKQEEDTKDLETSEETNQQGGLHEIPFGPYLAIGCFVSMLFGTQIISWYLGMF